ncbi:MAG TPA: hypothetical protein VMV28_07860 [Thermoplasmata archaeon]|nr:hypothetical protein [Thermoplasmata archaeon]
MSHIFQRPLCDMGRAYDFAFRPLTGETEPTTGGPCDDRPTRFELYAALADPASPHADRQRFSLCSEHVAQLRGYDAKLQAMGRPSRFRTTPA